MGCECSCQLFTTLVYPRFLVCPAKMASSWRIVVGTAGFVVPVTITCLDLFGYVAKVEGASMQVSQENCYKTKKTGKLRNTSGEFLLKRSKHCGFYPDYQSWSEACFMKI